MLTNIVPRRNLRIAHAERSPTINHPTKPVRPFATPAHQQEHRNADPMKTAPSATPKRPRTLAGNATASADGARAHAVAQYEASLRLMQEGKFEKAHTA